MVHDKPSIIAVLLAGGYGLRMHSSRPKQFIETDGESILLRTMRAFERHPLVNEIYVVCAPEWTTYVQRQAAIGHVEKFRQTMPAGATSQQSLFNAIKALETARTQGDTIVLVHESVRPFVSHEIITDNIITCQEQGNAVTAIYSHESYIRIGTDKSTQGYIPREELMRAQTPITLRMRDLAGIAHRAEQEGVENSQSLFTLMNQLGWGPLHVVEGNLLNFKITLPQDVEVYNRLRTLRD